MENKDTPIAAVKRAITKISSIALWPITILITKVNNATRASVRRAIRRRNKTAYFIAVFWYPVLVIGLALWAAIFIQPPDDRWPIVFSIKKWLVVVLVTLHGFERASRVLLHTRRRRRRQQSENE